MLSQRSHSVGPITEGGFHQASRDSGLIEWREGGAPHRLNPDLKVKHPSNIHVKVHQCAHSDKGGGGGTKPTQVRFSKLEWLLADGQTQKSRQKHSPGCLALLNWLFFCYH